MSPLLAHMTLEPIVHLLVNNEWSTHHRLLGDHALKHRVPSALWFKTSSYGPILQCTPSPMSPLLAAFLGNGVRPYDPREVPLVLHEAVPKLHKLLSVNSCRLRNVMLLRMAYVQEEEQSQNGFSNIFKDFHMRMIYKDFQSYLQL